MRTQEEDTVSVIIPVYNAEAYLAECIDSILRQTYERLQLILVNDGSTDNSAEVCDRYAGEDTRVLAVHTDNRGVSTARNTGIDAALGKYLCFVDADDILPEDSIQRLYGVMSCKDVQAAFGNYLYVFDGRSFQRHGRIEAGTHKTKELSSGLIDDGTLSGILFGSVCGAMYRKDLIKDWKIRFREDLKVNEDDVFNIEYCLNCTNIWYETKAVYHYRQWKKAKRDLNATQKRFKQANRALGRLATSQEYAGKIKQAEQQLQARTLFTVFQLSIFASAERYREAVPTLSAIWEEPLIKESDDILNFAHMNTYKRLLWALVRRGRKRLFYFTVHHVYPALNKFVKR